MFSMSPHLMRDIEGAMNGAAIGVLVCVGEEFVLVQCPVLIIHRVVKSDGDHLVGYKPSENVLHLL